MRVAASSESTITPRSLFALHGMLERFRRSAAERRRFARLLGVTPAIFERWLAGESRALTPEQLANLTGLLEAYLSSPKQRDANALLNNVVTTSKPLKQLLGDANTLLALESQILETLPEPLKYEARLARCIEGKLTLLVRNGSLATRLRFHIEDMRLSIQNLLRWEHVKIEIKVDPQLPYHPQQFDR